MMEDRPRKMDVPESELTETDGSGGDDSSHQGDFAGEDPDVLERLRNDGQQTLADAFTAHRERFWSLVSFRMHHRVAARVDVDDVLQEAFVAANTRLDHYLREPNFTLFVWLRMIVSQTLIDVHRRHMGAEMRSAGREVSIASPRFPQTTSVALAGHLISNQTSPSGAVSRDESAEKLAAAIETMSELDQETIALRHFEGLTNSETAEVLGLSVTAASNRYVRALSRLREILESNGSEEI